MSDARFLVLTCRCRIPALVRGGTSAGVEADVFCSCIGDEGGKIEGLAIVVSTEWEGKAYMSTIANWFLVLLVLQR